MSGIATRIDIKEELEAIERGECALCRINATHPRTDKCEETPAFKRMAECPAGHLYNRFWFRDCPECRIEVEEGEKTICE